MMNGWQQHHCLFDVTIGMVDIDDGTHQLQLMQLSQWLVTGQGLSEHDELLVAAPPLHLM